MGRWLRNIFIQVGSHMAKVETANTLKGKWSLTGLKRGGDVGAALTVIGDGCDMDHVVLTTFQHSDLAAGGRRRTVQGRARAIDSRRPVQVGPEHQIPSDCHHAAGAAVVHRDGRHRVDG